MTAKTSTPAPRNRPEGAPWPIADAAEYLSVSLRHLVRLSDANKVKTIKLGRRRMVPDDEIKRLAAEGCK
jgi:excisionase family DNA binding protein